MKTTNNKYTKLPTDFVNLNKLFLCESTQILIHDICKGLRLTVLWLYHIYNIYIESDLTYNILWYRNGRVGRVTYCNHIGSTPERDGNFFFSRLPWIQNAALNLVCVNTSGGDYQFFKAETIRNLNWLCPNFFFITPKRLYFFLYIPSYLLKYNNKNYNFIWTEIQLNLSKYNFL